MTVGVYILNIIDANVEAHLRQFNVDEDLSVKPGSWISMPCQEKQITDLHLIIDFKMNIALLGYGKMGKTIEEIAENRGHKIVLKVSDDIENHDLNDLDIDIAIDFSIPKAAFKNITSLF